MPTKVSRNKQRSVICFILWPKRVRANVIHTEVNPMYEDKC